MSLLDPLISRNLDLQKRSAENKKWNSWYKDYDYKFLSQDKIFDKVVQIINKLAGGGNVYYNKYRKYKTKYLKLVNGTIE